MIIYIYVLNISYAPSGWTLRLARYTDTSLFHGDTLFLSSASMFFFLILPTHPRRELSASIMLPTIFYFLRVSKSKSLVQTFTLIFRLGYLTTSGEVDLRDLCVDKSNSTCPENVLTSHRIPSSCHILFVAGPSSSGHPSFKPGNLIFPLLCPPTLHLNLVLLSPRHCVHPHCH